MQGCNEIRLNMNASTESFSLIRHVQLHAKLQWNQIQTQDNSRSSRPSAKYISEIQSSSDIHSWTLRIIKIIHSTCTCFCVLLCLGAPLCVILFNCAFVCCTVFVRLCVLYSSNAPTTTNTMTTSTTTTDYHYYYISSCACNKTVSSFYDFLGLFWLFLFVSILKNTYRWMYYHIHRSKVSVSATNTWFFQRMHKNMHTKVQAWFKEWF